MKISDLVLLLEKVVQEHGDIPVRTQTLSHFWQPELVVRDDKAPGKGKYLLLNA